MIHHLYPTQRHVVMLRHNPELNFGRYRRIDNLTEYYQKLQQRTSGLPTTIFVLAAPDFSFTEIF